MASRGGSESRELGESSAVKRRMEVENGDDDTPDDSGRPKSASVAVRPPVVPRFEVPLAETHLGNLLDLTQEKRHQCGQNCTDECQLWGSFEGECLHFCKTGTCRFLDAGTCRHRLHIAMNAGKLGYFSNSVPSAISAMEARKGAAKGARIQQSTQGKAEKKDKNKKKEKQSAGSIDNTLRERQAKTAYKTEVRALETAQQAVLNKAVAISGENRKRKRQTAEEADEMYNIAMAIVGAARGVQVQLDDLQTTRNPYRH